VALILFVKMAHPHLWEGFLEHARQTPSFTGLRLPHFDELLKVARTVPGIVLAALLLVVDGLKVRGNFKFLQTGPGVVLVAALLAALAVIGASLLVLTANTVAIANYLQPLVVGCYLAVATTVRRAGGGGLQLEMAQAGGLPVAGPREMRLPLVCLGLALALGSVRAVGMTTWGLACAHDVGYSQAIHRIDQELNQQPAGSVVVLSSAFSLRGCASSIHPMFAF